jgi:hypothetical protein
MPFLHHDAASHILSAALSHSNFRSQAQEDLYLVPKLLYALFECSPRFVAAAEGMDMTKLLIRLLRQLVPPAGSPIAEPHVLLGLEALLQSLRALLAHDLDTALSGFKPIIDAGLVPVLINLLSLRHEPSAAQALHLAETLLLATPHGNPPRWSWGLMGAVAGLLSAEPPVKPDRAAEVLFHVGMERRQLIADYQPWGIDASVRRLARSPHAGTAANAKKLLYVVNEGKYVSAIHSPYRDLVFSPISFIIVFAGPHKSSAFDTGCVMFSDQEYRSQGRTSGKIVPKLWCVTPNVTWGCPCPRGM